MSPNDPITRRIAESFDQQGLMSHLGARLGRVAAGVVHIHLPLSPGVTQHNGYFHGGASAAVADAAGGYAALTMMDEDSDVLSVELKINMLRPGRGHEVEAVGTVLKPGRTLTVCRLEVFVHEAGASTPSLIVAGQQTLIRVQTAG